MSRPTIEPLGDAGAGPGTTKDADVKDSFPRHRKKPEEVQQPVASIATELRELVNRQDQLLLLLRKSLNLRNPLPLEDGELRPDDSDPNHPNLDISDPDELENNNRFARSFHVDVTLDDVKLRETLEETVNLFLAAFQIEGGLGSLSTDFGDTVPPFFFIGGTSSRAANVSTSGSPEKPILCLEGFGDNGQEVINIQWGELREPGSGESAVDATKLTEVLRSKWRESRSDHHYSNHEFKLLNYDMDRYPRYLDTKNLIQPDHFNDERKKRDFFPFESHELVFGTVFKCRVANGFLSLRDLSLILHQLDARRSFLPYGSPGSPGDLTHYFAKVSLKSVTAFAGVWSAGQNRICWSLLSSDDGRGMFLKRGDSGWAHIEHHFRFLEIFQAPEMENTAESPGPQGICCNRVDGTLKLPHGHKLKAFKMIEGRYMVAVTTSLMLQSPVYSMTFLIEDKQYGLYQFRFELDQKSLQELNLQLGICCKGITIFQLALFRVIKRYSDVWTRSLDAIDQMVQVQPANILDNKTRRDLMFDRSLEKSELYFGVLQILRIMSEWIYESITDLENQKQDWADFHWVGHGDAEYLNVNGRETDRGIINSNWDLLILHHTKLVKVLQDRIDRKTKEVESLRDGLFNATQVREATRATRISQYIFVFTVMTIFYLPLSFVAALFGMHLFDGDDLRKTQSSFYISAVLIALVTYVLSGLAVWWVGDLERGQELKDWWQSWKAKISNRKDKFKGSAKTNLEKTGGAQSSAQESKYASLRTLLRPRKRDGPEPASSGV